jgi:glutaredoxin 3
MVSIYLDFGAKKEVPAPCGRSPGLLHTGHMVLIFGKEHCPYTSAAIDHYSRQDIEFEYIDVKKDRAELERMLGYSGGHRRVPVIVDEGKVTIGWGGT